MMTSESGLGWSRPHEYSWPRWSRPNDWYRNGYEDHWDQGRWDQGRWGEQGRWSEQGRWLDPRWQGYDRPRRPNGDWMREWPWMRESAPWLREPWMMQQSPWPRPDLDGAPVVKVIEVLAQSPHSWEDAARRAIAEASQTVRGIRSVYIQDMQAVVDDDQVVSFRINAKISFVLEDNRRRR